MNNNSEITKWQHIIDAMLAFTCDRVNRGSVSEIIVGGLEVFRELPGSKVVSLFLVNDDSFDFQYSNSVPEDTIVTATRRFKLLVDSGVIATALNSGQVTFYNRKEGDQLFEDILVIPLVGPKGIIGVVLVTLETDSWQLEHMLLRLCLLHSYQFASILYSTRVFRRLKNEKTVLMQKIAARTQHVEFEKRELRTLLDSIPAGIILFDFKTRRIVQTNAAALAVLSADDVKGLHYSSVIEKLNENVFQSDYDISEIDYHKAFIKTIDGVSVPVRCTFLHITVRSIKFVLLVFIKDCLYDEILQTKPLTQKEDILTSRAVGRELQDGMLHERMRSEKFRILGTFSRNLSHDLANIFNNIMGYAYLVKKNLKDHQKVQMYSDTIESTAQRGANLVLELKNLVVDKRGRAKEISLGEIMPMIIRDYHETVSNRIPNVDFDGNPLRIIINPKDFKNIIQVLVEDILSRYTSEEYPEEDRKIDISARLLKRGQDIDPALFPSSDHKGDYVQISLRYSTSPLDDTVVQSVFDPYVQINRDGEKNGLKLSSAYALMQRYGGTILCEVEATTGNVFKIVVPAAPGKGKHNAGMKTNQPGRSKQATILLVDDERAMRDLGQEVLRSEGYKVMVAEDGKRAVDIYKDNSSKIDLVILDLLMPVMDGRQAYVEMKKLNPDMKAFFCTAYTSDENILSLLKSEQIKALKKPFNLDQFLGLVDEVLLQ
jgi:CheY-like chemotaxis protein/signal transduction histidine kinase